MTFFRGLSSPSPHPYRQYSFPSWGTPAGLTEEDIYPVDACSSWGLFVSGCFNNKHITAPGASSSVCEKQGEVARHVHLFMPGLPSW